MTKATTKARTMLRHFMMIGMLAFVSSAAMAEPPSVEGYRQYPQAYALPVGTLKITALSDGTVPLDLHKLAIGIDAAQVDALLQRDFQKNPAETSINVFLIEGGGRRILVDAGAGLMFPAGIGGQLVNNLGAIGVRPDQITDVLITHLHSDHVGGLVDHGKIVFPNATVHASRTDLGFFLTPSEADRRNYGQAYFDSAAKAIGPYQGARRLVPFADGDEVLPGIIATIHPGHTPGSAFFSVSNSGSSIVFVGDVVDVAAVQLKDPRVNLTFDYDHAEAVSTRQTSLARFARERTLIAAPHLPFPGVGHVGNEGATAFTWHPITFFNRDAR